MPTGSAVSTSTSVVPGTVQGGAVWPDRRGRRGRSSTSRPPCLHHHSAHLSIPVAKHALLGMTKALGIEYAPKGIRVNALARLCVDPEGLRLLEQFPGPAAAEAQP